MVAMKIRSFVLIVCMVVVPGLALFSHLTPPSVRDLMRRTLCDPFCQSVRLLAPTVPSAPAAASMPMPEEPETAPLPPAAEPATQATASRAPGPLAVEEPPPPTGPSSASADVPRSPAEWAALGTLRKELTALGATAIDCRPQPGDVAGYASSCRIGIDPQGQLHRMFHGRGADAPAAMQSLIEQVRAWQTRQAGGFPARF
jgi:hypothetical protein